MWTEFVDDCRDNGLLVAVFMRLLFVALIVGFFPIWFPCCLISGFNEWTMSWFDGNEKEP